MTMRHPGLKAQVYVVCDKIKLVGVLFEKEPNVPLSRCNVTTDEARTVCQQCCCEG